MVRVQWWSLSQTFDGKASTADEAVGLVKRLSASVSTPTIVEFWDGATKRALGIGVGRDATVVTYQDSLEPPYFISVGDLKAEGAVSFCYGQEDSEYLRRNEIPMAKGIEAVKNFFQGSGRPASVSWESL